MLNYADLIPSITLSITHFYYIDERWKTMGKVCISFSLHKNKRITHSSDTLILFQLTNQGRHTPKQWCLAIDFSLRNRRFDV